MGARVRRALLILGSGASHSRVSAQCAAPAPAGLAKVNRRRARSRSTRAGHASQARRDRQIMPRSTWKAFHSLRMNPLDAYGRRWPCECGPYLTRLREGSDRPKSASATQPCEPKAFSCGLNDWRPITRKLKGGSGTADDIPELDDRIRAARGARAFPVP
jgi:hypothetical protein